MNNILKLKANEVMVWISYEIDKSKYDRIKNNQKT